MTSSTVSAPPLYQTPRYVMLYSPSFMIMLPVNGPDAFTDSIAMGPNREMSCDASMAGELLTLGSQGIQIREFRRSGNRNHSAGCLDKGLDQLPPYLFSGSAPAAPQIVHLYFDREFGITGACRAVGPIRCRPMPLTSRACVARSSGCARTCGGRKPSVSGCAARTRN